MPQLLGRTRPFSARLLSLLEAGPANRHCVREMLRLAEGSSTSFSTRLQRVKCNALTGKISSRVQTRKVVYCASNLEVTSVVHLAERLRGPLVNIARTVFFPHGARVRCGCGFPLPQYQTRVLCGRCIVFGGAFRLQLGNLQRRCLCRYVCLRCLFMYPLFHFGLNCQCFWVLSHVSLDIVVLYIWS